MTGVDLPKSLAGNRLLRLAQRAYQRAADVRDDYEVVILLSAISLEATVHELQFMGEFFAQCSPPESALLLADVLQRAEEERVSVIFKLELAYLAFAGHLPDRGSQPYQDVDLLMRLRNLLVHPRPETVSYGGRPDGIEFPKIVRSFGSRGIIPMPGADANLGWREHLLVKPVAAWAFNTVVRSMRWLAGACPHDGIKMVWTVRADEFVEL